MPDYPNQVPLQDKDIVSDVSKPETESRLLSTLYSDFNGIGPNVSPGIPESLEQTSSGLTNPLNEHFKEYYTLKDEEVILICTNNYQIQKVTQGSNKITLLFS